MAASGTTTTGRYAVRRKRCGCLVSSRPLDGGEPFATRQHPDGGTTMAMPLDQAAMVPEYCAEHRPARIAEGGERQLRLEEQEEAAGGAEVPVHPEAGATEPMMQFFAYEHLPGGLQLVSKPFAALARHLVELLPRNPERTAALRKLIEAKDCAVRAAIWREGA